MEDRSLKIAWLEMLACLLKWKLEDEESWLCENSDIGYWTAAGAA